MVTDLWQRNRHPLSYKESTKYKKKTLPSYESKESGLIARSRNATFKRASVVRGGVSAHYGVSRYKPEA